MSVCVRWREGKQEGTQQREQEQGTCRGDGRYQVRVWVWGGTR